ncbi:DUF4416 family protein [Desulfolutivibrio sp.]|uniref:DUF4416 family protein n=1 Tax=Desulfolutivibrio sp. TaxID=2773296 RepID=UPI002F96429B
MKEKGLFLVSCLSDKKHIENGLPNEILSSLTILFGSIYNITKPSFSTLMPEAYRNESGSDLGSTIAIFKMKKDISYLCQAKSLLVETERRFSFDNFRRYNLNPGIFHKGFLFMASHKNGPRRAQLCKDVWIEPQLRITNNTVYPLPWSFEEFLCVHVIKDIDRAINDNSAHWE